MFERSVVPVLTKDDGSLQDPSDRECGCSFLEAMKSLLGHEDFGGSSYF